MNSFVRRSALPSTLFLSLLLSTACLAQAVPPTAPFAQELRQVAHLSARSVVEVPQDRLQVVMSTTVQASDALAVQSQIKKALEQALVLAKKAAQPGQMDVRTGAFGLDTRQDNQGRVVGWQGSAELVLEGRDVALVTATSAAIKTLTVSRVAWDLSPDVKAAAEAKAQSQAIADFRRKALEVTKGFGLTGYEAREVTISSEGGPRPTQRQPMLMSRMGGGDALPVEAGKSQIEVAVSGSVQMR